MPQYRNLPDEIWRVIFLQMSPQTLFNLIVERAAPETDTNNQDAPLPAPLRANDFLTLARDTLFARRGKEASRYQSRLLGAYLNYWSTEKKLSFIKDHKDRDKWLNLLDAALKDPQSSYEHKIRCSLLINKLYPLNDRAEHIREATAEALKGLVTQSSATTDEMINTALSQLTEAASVFDNDRANCRAAAAETLGRLAAHASRSQCDRMINPLLIALKDSHSQVWEAAARSLRVITAGASPEQYDAVITALWSNVCHDWQGADHEAVTETLGTLAAHAPPLQRDQMTNKLLDCLGNKTWMLRRYQLLEILGAIVVHSSRVQRDLIINPILGRLEHLIFMNDTALISALGIMAAQASSEQLRLMIDFFLHNGLRNQIEETRVAAAIALSSLAAHLSPEQIHLIFVTLYNSLVTNEIQDVDRAAAAKALGPLAAYLQPSDFTLVYPLLLETIRGANRVPSVRQAAIHSLTALMPTLPESDLNFLCTLPMKHNEIHALGLFAHTRLLIHEIGRLNTPLIQAATKGDLNAVRTLLDNGENINAINGDGMTALMISVNNDEITRLLLQHNADACITTVRGTALSIAIGYGANVELIRNKQLEQVALIRDPLKLRALLESSLIADQELLIENIVPSVFVEMINQSDREIKNALLENKMFSRAYKYYSGYTQYYNRHYSSDNIPGSISAIFQEITGFTKFLHGHIFTQGDLMAQEIIIKCSEQPNPFNQELLEFLRLKLNELDSAEQPSSSYSRSTPSHNGETAMRIMYCIDQLNKVAFRPNVAPAVRDEANFVRELRTTRTADCNTLVARYPATITQRSVAEAILGQARGLEATPENAALIQADIDSLNNPNSAMHYYLRGYVLSRLRTQLIADLQDESLRVRSASATPVVRL